MTAWATVGEIAAILIAAAVAWWQLREVANARHLDSTLAILKYLDNENFGRIRWFLYENKEALNVFLHPQKPFCWEVKQEWDKIFQSLNKGRSQQIDVYSVRSLIHALDNIAFLIDRRYVPYDRIMPGMMENHFRIVNSLLGDYIRYSLKMEAANVLFRAPVDYVPSFGKNFLFLMESLQSRRRRPKRLSKIFYFIKARIEGLETKLDRLNNQRSVEDRLLELERALQGQDQRGYSKEDGVR